MARKKKQGTDDLPFGKILQQIMSDRKLTVRAVAELAGVSVSVVQNWTTGGVAHDLQAVSKLAQALGLSFKGLLLGEPEGVKGTVDVAEFFNEEEWFEGICKVSIKRLVPRKGGKS